MATQTASSSSSSSSSSSWKYEVFLSFCGVDTRKNFTDHLYTALKQKGIITFRDDEKLERGKDISQELWKAIEESKYAIIVLSSNYASSKWCLKELAKIVGCMKENNRLTVLPVFHYVDPSDVRNQTGTLIEAFATHEKDPKINTEDVQEWKAALKEVGNISGWHLQDRPEAIVIQEILGKISSELNCKFSSASKDLVGIASRVEKMLHLCSGERLGGVRFVGICGIGGSGKTSLAEEICKRISDNFEASCFIYNVREETKNPQGLVSLQKQLLCKILVEKEINIWDPRGGIDLIGNRLCNKKVLIVLDDVGRDKQLEALAGKRDWFGVGSTIIVTSRDSHLLRTMDDVYTTELLNNDEALELFSWRAFEKPHPEENYVDLCEDFVKYTNGLPLALKVLGSSLSGRSMDAWESARDQLKVEPNSDIVDILKISFDGLTDRQKQLFLDIACFFKGEDKDYIRDILQSFGYHPGYNLDVLVDKSLIFIEETGTLWMHDLLQEMGKEIVRRESLKEPGGRSRLWLYEDARHVLTNNTGTEAVEGIMVNTYNEKEEHLCAEAFSKMKKLRLLKIGNMKLPQGLNYLSNELRVIKWHGYPLKSMPTNFQPNQLFELRMSRSCIKQLWKGMVILDVLKVIDLSDSQYLIETPEFSGIPNLKQLILQRCTRLSKIHASLGNLKQLIRLDLNGCKRLESLPHKINLESLEVFILSGCSRLKKFPEIVGNMSHLLALYLNETAIKTLPLSVEHLTSLITLDLRHCKNLLSLPNAICSLTSLKTLALSGCSKLDELPENLGDIKGLEKLDVSGTAITRLPSSVDLLKNLKVLSLCGCEGLSSESSKNLLSFPLMRRRRPDPMSMLEHSLSGLWSLTELNLSYCNLRAIPDVFVHLSSLEYLNLIGNNIVCLPKSIIRLSKLEELLLSGCTDLRLLPELPLNIKLISAGGCTSLETLSIRPEDDFVPRLSLVNCLKLIENQGYDDVSLTMLRRYLRKVFPSLSLPHSLSLACEVLSIMICMFQEHSKQNLDNPCHCLEIPGSEIPKWFSHQKVGASMNLQVPSDLFYKCMGIAVCVVYVFHQHHPYYKITHWLCCSVKVNGDELRGVTFGLSEEFAKIESHHFHQQYLPLSQEKCKKALSQSDANGFIQIEIKFKLEGPGLEVTKCGVHLLYEEDIEDQNQTMGGCSITPYEDDEDDLAKEDTAP
ncbi:TMV resistance protein N-like [Fagus crenata]